MIYLCLFLLLLNGFHIYHARWTDSNEDFNFPIKLDLEKQLKNKFAQKIRSEKKFRRLNDRIANDTEYFDEIPHFLASSSRKIRTKQGKMEVDFQKVMGMDGFKYTYKRDFYWRTWREITDGNETKVICYRCQNIVYPSKSNCTNCNNGGYWVIEESQPSCSYEIFSFKNNDELCVADIWQLNKANISSCPSVIPYEDLLKCHDTITTNFHINKDYSKNISERALPVICQGRENCDISTVYSVTLEKIIFRIINTTNNIIYSRIMKNDGRNYVCVEDCGIFDYATKTATKNEDHLVLDLLSPIKQKRDNKEPNIHRLQKTKVQSAINNALGNDQSNSTENISLIVEKYKYILEKPIDRKHTVTSSEQKSLCKQILLKEHYG